MDEPQTSNDHSKVLSEINYQLNCAIFQTLIGVKWYLDGELLKHVEKDRECWEESNPNNPKCNVDPTKIILVNVKRTFHGEYSCAGRNRAGWGMQSPKKELQVHYPPTEAKIKAVPDTILKGQPFQVRTTLPSGRVTIEFSSKLPSFTENLNQIWRLFPCPQLLRRSLKTKGFLS